MSATYLPLDKIQVKDSSSMAGLNRFRVSLPTIVESKNWGDNNTTNYTVTGSTSFDVTKKVRSLNSGGASALQTTTPAILLLQGVFAEAQVQMTNSGANRLEHGVGDANNGYFWNVINSVYSVSNRSKVTGVVVNTDIPRTNWNIDKLDGSGPSGLTVDFTKYINYIIDLGSLLDRVRFGVKINGVVYYCHQIINDGLSDPPIADYILPYRHGSNGVITGGMNLLSYIVYKE